MLTNEMTIYEYLFTAQKSIGTTGIWQTIWIEALNKNYIEKVKFTPDIDNDYINIEYFINELKADLRLKLEISFGDNLVNIVTTNVLNISDKIGIKLNNFNFHDGGRLWSPERPNLYDIKITLIDNEIIIEQSSVLI